MADGGDEDLVSKVQIDGLDESTAKLKTYGDVGAKAFDKVSDAASKAGVDVKKSTADIEKGVNSADKGVQSLGRSFKQVNAGPTASQLKQVEAAARDLSSRAVKVTKDIGQFAVRMTALATAGAAAIVGIGKLGATIAAQVNQTTSAFDKNNAAQQRAVSASLSAEQASIQYASQQRQLNRQLATGAITYDQYSTTLKSNQQTHREQIRVTTELESAQESARIETERLQKAAADHKAYDALIQTYGGPLTGALIALGNTAIATKNQFIQAFGPGAASVVDLLTTALNNNGQAISSFFAAAGAKISEFVNSNGPAIQQALASIGSAAATIFNGLIAAMPTLLAFFNTQLVPAIRTVAGFVDGLVQGFNKIFGTEFTTGAAVVIVALGYMTSGFKTLLGSIGLIRSAILVLQILFQTMLGPIGLLVVAFAALYLAIDWQKFGQNAVAAGQAIIDFFSGLPDTITGFFTGLFNTITDGWNTLAQAVIDAWGAVTDFFSGLPDTVGSIFTSIGESIKSAFTAAFDAVKSYVMSWVETIKNLLQPLIDMINVIAGGASGGGDSGDGFARGGHIRGRGTSTSDSIPAWLSDNEFVIRAKAVRKYGTNFMRAVNSGRFDPNRIARFAAGGLVSAFSPAPAYATSNSGGGSGGGGGTLNLTIDGKSFDGLTIPDKNTADELARYVVQRQMTSAGRKPSWTIPRR